MPKKYLEKYPLGNKITKYFSVKNKANSEIINLENSNTANTEIINLENVNLENSKNVNLEIKLENSPKSDKEMKKKHQKFNTMLGTGLALEERVLEKRESNWRGTTASSNKVIKGGGEKEVLSVDKRRNPETRPDKSLKTPKKAK